MDSTNKKHCLLASEVYLSFLLSNNSPIHTLFTPTALFSLLRTLRVAVKPVPKPQDQARNQNRKGRPRHDENDFDEDSIEDGGQREEGGDEFEIRDVDSVLEKLNLVLGKIGLERFPDSLTSLIEVVCKIWVDAVDLEAEFTGKVSKFSMNRVKCGSFDRICQLCFRVLITLMHPEHGDVTNTCVDILKSICPAILSQNLQIRANAIRFVTSDLMGIANNSDEIRRGIVSLPRYLAVKADTDKIDSRSVAVNSIMKIVQFFSLNELAKFSGFIVKMSVGKARLRMMAIDLIAAILGSISDPLAMKEGNPDSSLDIEGKLWGVRCVEALVNRCSDKVAGIRARALLNLAQVVETLTAADVRNRVWLQELFVVGNGGRAARASQTFQQKGNEGCSGNGIENEGLFFSKETISPDFGPGPTPITPGVSCRDLNSLVRRRCTDEKAAVRKAALNLITRTTFFLGRAVDESMLRTIGTTCSDPLMSIRKAGMTALSGILKDCCDKRVIKEWVRSVPQMILDNESSIQAECESLFLELVLERISRVASSSASNTRAAYMTGQTTESFESELQAIFSEAILFLLKEMCNVEVYPHIKKLCTSLGKKKRLSASVGLALQNIITSSESLWLSRSMPLEKWAAPPGAWMLLSEVSAYLPKAVGWKFLQHHWKLLDKPDQTENNILTTPFSTIVGDDMNEYDSMPASWAGDRVFLLRTISNVAMELPPEPAAELAHNLLARLETFDMHPTEVNAHIQALGTLSKKKAARPVDGDALVAKWAELLLSKSSQIVEKHLSEISKATTSDDFRTPPSRSSRYRRKGKKKPVACVSPLHAATAVFTVGSLALICPDAELKCIIPLIEIIITCGDSKRRPQELVGLTFSRKQISPSIYIQAWLTLGKICLADEKLAKRYIALFVQELEKSDSAPLRNNLMILMTDFCVRYTALVDCYITKITKCLRDPCEVIRRQTFILLSGLLQRDYVKWRGVLFHRFLLTLVDDSEKIRRLADFLFSSFLKSKAPLLAYNSFVEAIFLLNGFQTHSQHSENGLFTLRGSDDRSQMQRMHIYVSLLKQMAPEQLLATSAKLCADILAAAADGMLNVDDSTAQSVLKDALLILACKDMRIQPLRGAADPTDMDEDSANDNRAFAAARGRVVTQVAKKNLIQNAVPIFIELKKLLESKNSPLTGSLMECLRTILKEFKNELAEILVADKQLQKELIYDIQKYEAAKAKSAVADAVATAPRSAQQVNTKNASAASTTAAAPNADASGGMSSRPSKGEHARASASTIVSAVADVAATATVNAVLKDVRNGVPTPPLHSMSIPKLKTSLSAMHKVGDQSDLLESLCRRQTFSDSDEEG